VTRYQSKPPKSKKKVKRPAKRDVLTVGDTKDAKPGLYRPAPPKT
jgi:hypothetical protein